MPRCRHSSCTRSISSPPTGTANATEVAPASPMDRNSRTARVNFSAVNGSNAPMEAATVRRVST